MLSNEQIQSNWDQFTSIVEAAAQSSDRWAKLHEFYLANEQRRKRVILSSIFSINDKQIIEYDCMRLFLNSSQYYDLANSKIYFAYIRFW